jgi:hypothetical protein
MAIWRQHWVYSCLWLSLLTAGRAQPAVVESPLGAQDIPSRVERGFDTVAGSRSADHRMDAGDRMHWFVRSIMGAQGLVGGLFSAALGTAVDTPSEYGPHWEGMGKRYGMRLTGISTGNAIEGGLGVIDGEDPRYFKMVHRPFGSRVKNVVDLTFRAYRADGERHLAYARFGGTVGNNFLSNTWRARSEADWQHALVRTAEGFGSRALSNTLSEFLPQAWRKIRHRPEPALPEGGNP